MPNSMVRQVFMAAVVGMGVATIAAAPPSIAAEAPITIPATAGEIWKAIDMHIKELHADIDKGVLKNAHQHAFAVRDLVQALPTHSAGLSPDALAKVTEQSKFVATLATRLDETGDANDKPGTVANLAKLEGVLKTIRANYPAGT
jgi:hypothetical protein